MTQKPKENHTKPLRLFRIEQAIQNMSYPSVERLMAELEVSRRTILRDIDELKIYYNAPIEYDRINKGSPTCVVNSDSSTVMSAK